MRSECVRRKSGAPRALAAGLVSTRPPGQPSRDVDASNAASGPSAISPASGSFGGAEVTTSPATSRTPQHRAALAVELAWWWQRLAQHESARALWVCRAGAP